MKLYKATDKVDGCESFFLVYPDRSVAVMYPTSIDQVKRNSDFYSISDPERIADALNPVLLAEW